MAEKVIDLETGKASGGTGRISVGQKGPESKPKAESAQAANVRERAEAGLAGRIEKAFDKLASALANKGDEELSEAITEDGKAMSNALVSLTRNIPVLRPPLTLIINLLEPVLAFGRTGSILYRRAMERRMLRAQMRAEMDGAGTRDTPSMVG